MRLINHTINMQANRPRGPKRLVKVEMAECDNGRVNLQVLSAHDMKALAGNCEISREQFEQLPDDLVEEARAVLALCGWST